MIFKLIQYILSNYKTMKKIQQILKYSSFFLIILLLLGSCKKNDKPVIIAISKAYPNIKANMCVKWLSRNDNTIEFVNMYTLSTDSVEDVLKKCSGLLLTGGADVFPGRYGKIDDTARCGSFDLRRDTLEFELINIALKNKIPVLGICRGEQILNVAMDGSLIIDIPTDVDTIVKHRCKNVSKCMHNINIRKSSFLYDLYNNDSIIVNSNHHQAIEKLADSFKIMARANDSIIEGIQWKNPTNKSFLMAVQFHPEVMDTLNILANNIAKKFIAEAKKYSKNH